MLVVAKNKEIEEGLIMAYVKNMSSKVGGAPLILHPCQIEIQQLCVKHNIPFALSQDIPIDPDEEKISGR